MNTGTNAADSAALREQVADQVRHLEGDRERRRRRRSCRSSSRTRFRAPGPRPARRRWRSRRSPCCARHASPTAALPERARVCRSSPSCAGTSMPRRRAPTRPRGSSAPGTDKAAIVRRSAARPGSFSARASGFQSWPTSTPRRSASSAPSASAWRTAATPRRSRPTSAVSRRRCESGDAPRADAEHRELCSTIDKAVKRGALHQNTGAHKKSRAARLRAGARRRLLARRRSVLQLGDRARSRAARCVSSLERPPTGERAASAEQQRAAARVELQVGQHAERRAQALGVGCGRRRRRSARPPAPACAGRA